MAAKKTTTKKTATPAAKKTAAKKTAAKKTAAKKTAAKKTPAKKAPAPRRMAAKVSPLKGMPVEQYLATKVTGWQADVAGRIVALVQKAVPDAAVAIKWGQPVFELNGPFAYVKPAKAHVTFGFWRGTELADPKRMLGDGGRMTHVKLTSPQGVDEAALSALVKQAAKLNREKGDPTKR
jgi:hypothetical protein